MNLTSNSMTDQAGHVRAVEELDLDRLNPWRKSRIGGISGEPQVTQNSRGASNWTYCLSYPEQQIYFRYYNKQTRNPQFKHIWVMVNYLLHRCRKNIKQAG